MAVRATIVVCLAAAQARRSLPWASTWADPGGDWHRGWRARVTSAALWLMAVATLTACGEETAATAVIEGDVGDGSDTQGAGVDDATDESNDAGDGLASGDGPIARDCPGGPFCPCESAADCDSGTCIDTLAGRVCAVSCVSNCPEGFACLAQGRNDVSYFCHPSHGLICRPCDNDLACVTPGNADSVCVRHGDDGGYCGSACTETSDCPEGFACAEVTGVSGGAYLQCVRNGASATPDCACSTAARKAGWQTTCWQAETDSNGTVLRRCKGQRQCGPDGMGACEAQTPAVCYDVQCLVGGETGAAPRADGASCEDGEACTKGDHCDAGQCKAGVFVCACAKDADCEDDNNLCNGVPFCDTSGAEPTCKLNPATVVTCDGSLDTSCSHAVCVKSTGACVQEPALAGEACSDGVACTADDHCDGKGNCLPGTSTCPCKTSADCPDDADLCNGVPYCDTTAVVPTCKPNPATIVQCSADGDTACVKNVCQAKSGTCQPASLPEGAPCDDGDACTHDDVCTTSGCAGKAACACTTSADCATKEDGDLCNGTLYCDVATKNCKVNPVTVITCKSVDDTTCAVNTCQKASGSCALLALGAKPCDDGNACTLGDTCAGGSCGAGTNSCICDADADCAAKDDGNLCNGTLYCDKSNNTCAVNPATVINCPSVNDTACTKNLCQPQTGACATKTLLDGAACEDDNACTANEVCLGGACVGGSNPCVCSVDADCVDKDDGNLCNGTLYCDKPTGLCQLNPASVPTCTKAGDSACLANQCVHVFDLAGAATATTCKLLPRPDGMPCDDGVACTEGDVCKAGTCAPGKKTCACKTIDDCNAGPSDPCVGPSNCVSGVCVEGATKTCPSEANTPCLASVCDSTTGGCKLKAQNDTKICDDGDPCSAQSACSAGTCAALVATNCDDGNTCTTDACDAKSGGCTHSNNVALCNDGNACTIEDACANGSCKGKPGMEICGNGLDDDCDGKQDEEGAIGCKTTYRDDDGDGWASSTGAKCLCGIAGSYKIIDAAKAKDCNDGAADVYPGAPEDCAATDRNCDGHKWLKGVTAAESLAGCKTYYVDKDGDAFFTGTFPSKCLCEPAGDFRGLLVGDCDDGNAKVHPLQTAYQTTPRSNGSYDYNCDNVTTQQYGQGACPGNSSCMTKMVPGFIGTPPACGASGPYVLECSKQPVQCKSSKSETRVQGCR